MNLKTAPPVYRPAAQPPRTPPPPAYRPQAGQPVQARTAPPVYRPATLSVAPSFRMPAPPPLGRPAQIQARVAVRVPARPPIRPVVLQRALAVPAPGPGPVPIPAVTIAEATQFVEAHPPDDYPGFPESTIAYLTRNQALLDNAHLMQPHKSGARAAFDPALTAYRAAQVLAAQQAAQQRQQSEAALAVFDQAAANHANQVIRSVRNHTFQAEVREGAPVGLHAYTDEALPANVTALLTIGNVDQVHIIVWTAPGAAVGNQRKCKWSTMFPRYMPKGMVCWYILHERDAANYSTAARPLVPPFNWAAINLGQAGETNYPEYAGGEAAARVAIQQAAGQGNYRTVQQNGAQRRYVTVNGTEYIFSN